MENGRRHYLLSALARRDKSAYEKENGEDILLQIF